MSQPIIELHHLCRSFPAGDEEILILDQISLTIERGEMVAIIGQSGSGKSTLMNILGGLDRPSTGRYCFAGVEVGELDADGQARLRRDHFGFIFQRYHLLGTLNAVENVSMPAIYAGVDAEQRLQRAAELLGRLGLSERLDYKPHQLSGGQQQRVSIARALMNGGEVILADEPTGALDSKSGEDVLQILRELHQHGHTVILVTHDAKVAAQADRIIEIRDGRIIADTANPQPDPLKLAADTPPPAPKDTTTQAAIGRWKEAFAMALRAMLANRVRTLLTMLGIIIGIASVVSIMALGQGMERKVLDDFASFGVNNVFVYPGAYAGDDKARSIRTLRERDLQQLSQEPYLEAVSPVSMANVRARFGGADASVSVQGVGDAYFAIRNQTLLEGVSFSEDDIAQQSQVVVIGATMNQRLFGGQGAIGQVILLGNIPVQVIGVAENKSISGGDTDRLEAWVPYTTAASRLLGQQHFNSMIIRVKDDLPVKAAEAALQQKLLMLHGTQDFYTRTMEDMMKSFESTAASIRLFLLLIAVISLVVGGIGVMNIMLVSVTERTHEIGIRMAVGARQSDIRNQFLIEAVLVCLLGAAIGIGLSGLLGAVVNAFLDDFRMLFTLGSIVIAVVCASAIGIVFGYLPASRAAKLAPIDALARE